LTNPAVSGLIPAMGLNAIPKSLQDRYRFQEWNHAAAILAGDFPEQWADLLGCLDSFKLKKSAIVVGGGGRSQISMELDGYLNAKGWAERHFDIGIRVDGADIHVPTHSIDNFKGGVGIEVEWNNKTEFYDRDLNNFRLLHQLRVLSVGVIITRASELQDLFDELKIGTKYGASTTHWNKLLPKINGGGAGGCPVLAIAITQASYLANM
jgi:Restriction endonuclease BglII